MLRQVNAPVIAFFLGVLGGWGISIYFGGWWWMAIGLLAGDEVEAMLSKSSSGKNSDKGTPKH